MRPHPVSTARLQVEGDALRLAVRGDAGSPAWHDVSAESIAPIRRCLRHEPVTAAELEMAIAETEDLIMPVLRQLPSGAALEVVGTDFREVLGALPKAVGGQPVAIEAVEELFNRLANVATGSPAQRQGVPVSVSFALGLLILREVMHHGGFAEVRGVAPGAAP